MKIKQLRARMKQYSSYVKENFSPQLPEEEEEEKPDLKSQGHQETEEDEDLDEE